MGAELMLIIGESGSGKTSSLRYINPETSSIVTPNSKSLPIPGMDTKFIPRDNRIVTNEISSIGVSLEHISKNKPKINLVIIEDLNHFFNARVTSPEFRSRGVGGEAFARWNDFGADVASNLVTVAERLRNDLTVVVFAHTDVKDNGKVGIKTSGKLLDNTIDIPSYVTCLLHSLVIEEDGKTKYKFLTNSDGIHSAKTPAGMFVDKLIPNDLFKVLNTVKDYKSGSVEAVWED